MQIGKLAGKWVRNGSEAFVRWRIYSNSHKQADRYRQKVVESKAHPFVNDKIIERSKEESNARFGDPGHWHWLALYAEIREEYIEGWLPDDIYSNVLIPFLNPKRLTYMSTLKSNDHRIFDNFATPPLAVFINGAYYDAEGKLLSERQFLNMMTMHNAEVVIKKDSAPSGEGIWFKHSSEILPEDFINRFSYVLQPLFRQHPDLAKPYHNSVNTVRISTCLNFKGEVAVKHLLFRLGRGGSRIVNAGKKDIDIYIDSNGNVLKNAVDGFGIVHGDRHPDTGVKYKDLKVPAMNEAIEACKKAHYRFPYLRFIAWDVYIDHDLVPRMIEWNTVNPVMWVHEAHIGPLWTKEEIDEAMEDRDE